VYKRLLIPVAVVYFLKMIELTYGDCPGNCWTLVLTTGLMQPNGVILQRQKISAVGMTFLAYIDVGVVRLVSCSIDSYFINMQATSQCKDAFLFYSNSVIIIIDKMPMFDLRITE